MNSKEALKELCSRCYVESDLCSCHPRYSGGKCNNTCKYKETIEQDLDRLEKLEKAIEILKRFNFSIFTVKNNNNETGFKIFTDSLLETQEITQQEYELLKEVLENE